jgi:pantetheine-phosphate adenylyltransferase
MGHLDVIERAAAHFDRVVIACLLIVAKAPMFAIEERLELVRGAVGSLENVEIDSFDGLLVDFCRARGVYTVVKGLRAVSDFESEMQMSQMNAHLAGVETLFLTTSPLYSFLSSSLVKEVTRFGGDVASFVPANVAERLEGSSAPAQLPGEG